MTRSDEPFLVTTARKSPRDEQRGRERRYLVTMAVRVVCFILAIVLFEVHLQWAAAVAVAGSLVLPWIAVVMANAGTVQTVERPSLYAPDGPEEPERPALGSGNGRPPT